LQLKYRGAAPKTWLDTYEAKVSNVDNKELRFEEKESELRDKAAERGRRKVPALVRKSMDAGFARLDYNPYDIKAILHPVDFIVFDGLENKNEVRNIVFLSKATASKQINALRTSLRERVQSRNYDWKVARISSHGQIEMTEG